MNSYGQRLMKAWETLAPDQYAKIKDPNHHFSTLGEEAQELIEDGVSLLPSNSLPGETYLQSVGRINAMKQQIEESVMRDLMPDLEKHQLRDLEDEQPSTSNSEDLNEHWTGSSTRRRHWRASRRRSRRSGSTRGPDLPARVPGPAEPLRAGSADQGQPGRAPHSEGTSTRGPPGHRR